MQTSEPGSSNAQQRITDANVQAETSTTWVVRTHYVRIRGNGLGDLFAWVLSAVASGVLGNAAYSAVRHAYTARRKKLQVPSHNTARVEENYLLAKLAVQARCAEIDWQVPRFEDLHDAGWRDDSDGFIIHIDSTSVQAEVRIPRKTAADQRIEVMIYTLAATSRIASVD